MAQKQDGKSTNGKSAISFNPDEDVQKLIERARANGITLRHLCNSALRRYLPPIVDSLDRIPHGDEK